ncbi:hypothetical protein [Herbiconiux liangxiaofengii]|uniref:hypothetical protein n=1 Tax=Herbiconiux liangxiaofengii TaxID=3342795 RepID=UPI0035BB64EA
MKTHVDPTISTPETEDIKRAYYSLGAIETLSIGSLTAWVEANPRWVPVLGLTVGLGQERLKNELKHQFDTSGWITLARRKPAELIHWLDNDFNLVHLLSIQRFADYNFADVLVERAGTRVTATQAGQSGRRVEDLIEAIADELGLPYQTRTRFTGRNNQTAPCDLVVPNTGDAQIVVAAKGFNSTGSKLSDAVREIQEMADVRKPTQFVMAVIDGIGWKSRVSDLKRIYQLWGNGSIDGMYTLATLDVFREDLEEAARLRRLI